MYVRFQQKMLFYNADLKLYLLESFIREIEVM